MSGRQHLLYSIYVYILLLYLHVHAGFLNTQAIFALVIPNASDLPVIGLYLKIIPARDPKQCENKNKMQCMCDHSM